MSSGLPVSFSVVSGPATISGNTVTLTGTGTVVIRASQAGNADYNAAPDVDQSFTVSLPQTSRTVRMVSGTGSPGGTVAVPIELVAQGNENAVGFSLNFSTSQLTYGSVTVGSGAPGATLNLNTAQAATGRIGVSLALSPGQAFAAGTRQVASVTFTLANGLAGGTTISVSFGNTPFGLEVISTTAESLPASYVDGTVSVLAGYEADVSPKPNGSGTLTLGDWVQAGRFYAGLDPVSTGEFQRADCAPRMSSGTLVLGDGKITLGDWVQAGRYYAGLDPITPLGGPSSPITPLSPGNAASADGKRYALQNMASMGRRLKLVNTSGAAGATLTAPVMLMSLGDENAVAFSLNFDPARLSFVRATLGAGASGSQLLVQTKQLSDGHVGIAISGPPGESFKAGEVELANVTFTGGAVEGSAALSFGDAPLAREILDVSASPLVATFTGGTINIRQLQPKLVIVLSGNHVIVSWPSSVEGFALEVAGSLASPTVWSEVSQSPAIVEDRYTVTLPHPSADKFYRLRHP